MCYPADIDPGFGMISQGNNQFSAVPCPKDTYGAADKVWGWAAAPCKPCPRNMITDGATRVTNMSVCVNDDGFGMASEGKSCWFLQAAPLEYMLTHGTYMMSGRSGPGPLVLQFASQNP
jgi:hypothetical protein